MFGGLSGHFDPVLGWASEFAETQRLAGQHIDGAVHGLSWSSVRFACGEIERDQRVGRPVHEPRGQAVMLGDGQCLPIVAREMMDVGQQMIGEDAENFALRLVALEQRDGSSFV